MLASIQYFRRNQAPETYFANNEHQAQSHVVELAKLSWDTMYNPVVHCLWLRTQSDDPPGETLGVQEDEETPGIGMFARAGGPWVEDAFETVIGKKIVQMDL
jgi:hypothetical protein